MAGRFALPHAYGLDENLVEARCLAEDDRLTGLTGHTAQGTSRGTGTYERVGMDAELLHARLIAKDASLGTFRRRVNGKHGQPTAFLLQQMDAKLVDTRSLASTRHATDTDAHAIATIGQTARNHLLGTLLMIRVHTLNEGHGLREDGDVALDDTLDHLTDGQLATTEA